MDIEITGYRVLYSENNADKGVAKLISWFSTVGPVDCINRVFEYHIWVYQPLFVEYNQLWLDPPLAMPLKWGTQLIFKILEVYLCDHTHQLEYSKQYSMIESYYRFSF